YSDGVVIPEQTPKPEAADSVIDYLPTTWPGARLPHFWVRRGQERLTLLDLPQPDTLILLTHPPGRERWQKAAAVLLGEVPFRLNCVSVGPEGSADLIDEQGTWSHLSQIGVTGAILVRPDGHVAWRCQTAPADPCGALRDVFRTLRLHA